MSKQWIAVCVVLGATTVAHGQYPSYYNPYYSRTPGYSYAPAQRYYSPYPNGGYSSAPATQDYSSAPRYNYTPYYGASAPRSPISYPSSDMPAPEITQAPMLPAIETDNGTGRFRNTAQVEQFLPPAPAPSERGNVAILWDKLFSSSTPPPEMIEDAFPNKRPQSNDCIWGAVNYQASFIRPMRLNGPLVSTGSFSDPFPGSLGQPTTAVLFGANNVNFNLANGGNVMIGAFVDSGNRFSLELGGFAIFPSRQSTTFQSDDMGNPIITRPVTALDQPQGSFAVSVPTLIAGSTRLDFESQLYGIEANGRYHSCLNNYWRYDLLLGARYARLSEKMIIEDNLRGINGNQLTFNGFPADSITRQDSFGTENHFIGGQLGARLSYEQRWFYMTGFAKLGLGATMQQVTIDGFTNGTTGGVTQTAPGGILALPSNIGVYNRTVFGVLPELGLTCGLNVTDHVRLQLGYSTLLWNSVVRPGHQYSTTINSALAPSAINFGNVVGGIAPTFRFNDELFWVHSLNLGIFIHY